MTRLLRLVGDKEAGAISNAPPLLTSLGSREWMEPGRDKLSIMETHQPLHQVESETPL